MMHNERRTTDDDGRQPKAIGHLSDSGDLKTIETLGIFINQVHSFDIYSVTLFIRWNSSRIQGVMCR